MLGIHKIRRLRVDIRTMLSICLSCQNIRTHQTQVCFGDNEVRTTSELLKIRAMVGNKLDTAAPDHEAMKFLLRARRAVTAELEARHLEAERQAARQS